MSDQSPISRLRQRALRVGDGPTAPRGKYKTPGGYLLRARAGTVRERRRVSSTCLRADAGSSQVATAARHESKRLTALEALARQSRSPTWRFEVVRPGRDPDRLDELRLATLEARIRRPLPSSEGMLEDTARSAGAVARAPAFSEALRSQLMLAHCTAAAGRRAFRGLPADRQARSG